MIFKVDPDKRGFELLKETEYDPQTRTGQSRFMVHWTDETVFLKIVERTGFNGIEGPVFTEFRGIDAANEAALREGRPFVARVATMMDGANAGAEPEIEPNQVTAWFTPGDGEPFRSGHIELDGRRIPVTLRDRHWRIFHHQSIPATSLAEGFWKATLHGGESNGRFVIDRIEVSPQPDPRDADDPELPRVLVIGDSISMNYHDAAKDALDGIANYHRNEGNAFSSAHGVRNTELWLGDFREPGLHWDVIQFNHGLHDLRQDYDASTDTFGGYAVPLEDYKSNLEKQIAILRKTGAKLIWCTTTPVPGDRKDAYARRKGAPAIFNRAAAEVMKRHPDILVTDLHGLIEGSPAFDEWRIGNDVHFYQEEERRILGDAVAATIRKALADPVSDAF